MTKAIEFNGEKLTKYLKQRGITKKRIITGNGKNDKLHQSLYH